jgi:transcriptional regulator with XRE-family HTH domain
MTTAEFAAALRRWRDRVTPAAVGLPAGGHRRAAGLRREEVALLAGISVDYITRLEQGRATSPSAQVVEAIARALRLSRDEREHLFRLAAQPLPGPGTVPSHITPSVQRLLDRLSGTPVSVSDAAWTLLTCNPLWAALIGDPSTLHGWERNSVWRHFLSPNERVLQTPEQAMSFERSMAADLRGATGRYPADKSLQRLIAELHTGSPRFAELWDSGIVGTHESARKTVKHPEVGLLDLDCDIMTVNGADLRIVAFTAEPGTESADKLALLSVLGTQALA